MLCKLMNKTVYGKTMENLRNRIDKEILDKEMFDFSNF